MFGKGIKDGIFALVSFLILGLVFLFFHFEKVEVNGVLYKLLGSP
jgi:hypothetical protein